MVLVVAGGVVGVGDHLAGGAGVVDLVEGLGVAGGVGVLEGVAGEADLGVVVGVALAVGDEGALGAEAGGGETFTFVQYDVFYLINQPAAMLVQADYCRAYCCVPVSNCLQLIDHFQCYDSGLACDESQYVGWQTGGRKFACHLSAIGLRMVGCMQPEVDGENISS